MFEAGGETGIFLSPKAYIEGESSDFSKSQSLKESSEVGRGIFQSPRAYMKAVLGIFPSPKAHIDTGVPNPIYRHISES